MLATVNGDLTAIHPDGARSVVAQSLGVERVWYCGLPGGRTTFSSSTCRRCSSNRRSSTCRGCSSKRRGSGDHMDVLG